MSEKLPGTPGSFFIVPKVLTAAINFIGMKHRLLLPFTFALITLAAFAPPQKKHKKRQVKESYKEVGAMLPPFRVYTTTGTVFTNDSLSEAGNLLLMLFNPTCDHCGMVTDTLLRYYSGAQKSRLLFVAGDNMMPYLPRFIREHQLDKYPSVRVGVDSSQLIQQTFLYEPLPQVNIYDPTRHLVRIWTGLQPGSSFLPYLR